MKHIDSEMAARVWQRVQASLNGPAQRCQADDRPIPRYRVPPEAWRNKPAPSKTPRSACNPQPTLSLPWAWLVLLWLLTC